MRQWDEWTSEAVAVLPGGQRIETAATGPTRAIAQTRVSRELASLGVTRLTGLRWTTYLTRALCEGGARTW